MAYVLGENRVTPANFQGDLGIIVRDDLSWTNHYSHLCSRAYTEIPEFNHADGH